VDVFVYTFESCDGAPQTFTTYDGVEAQRVAERNGWRLIENRFAYADHEVVYEPCEAPGPSAESLRVVRDG